MIIIFLFGITSFPYLVMMMKSGSWIMIAAVIYVILQWRIHQQNLQRKHVRISTLWIEMHDQGSAPFYVRIVFLNT